MNNIITGFDQILEFAKSYGLPLTKKRAILREYLQVKILDLLYQERVSPNLFFVGGTSLRLLYNLDRFSEDLDFDLGKIEQSEINKVVENVYKKLLKENIEVDVYKNLTFKRAYYELRFKNLLYELKISANKEEKVMIKFDFESFWRRQKREVVLLKRYGFLVSVVTVPLEQILVQKLYAFLKRKQTLPRDIYDIIWLVSQETKIDQGFIEENRLSLNLVRKAREKFEKERRLLKNLKLKLRPFLVNEEHAEKLKLFSEILKDIELKKK